MSTEHHPKNAQAWIGAIVLILVTAIITTVINLGGDVAAAKILRSEEVERRDLEHRVAGFRAFTDTRYLPVVGTQFWRQHVYILHVSILNNGVEPEEDVHVVLTRAGEIGAAVQDPNAIALDTVSKEVLDFQSFVGEEKVDFVIPSIPSGGTYDFQVVSIAPQGSELPILSVQSRHSVSSRELANPAWVLNLLSLLSGSSIADEEGEWVRVLEW